MKYLFHHHYKKVDQPFLTLISTANHIHLSTSKTRALKNVLIEPIYDVFSKSIQLFLRGFTNSYQSLRIPTSFHRFVPTNRQLSNHITDNDWKMIG